MKSDTPGFLDVKLVVVTKQPEAWLAALAALGAIGDDQRNGEWAIREVRTSATVADRTLRVHGYVGPPTADVRVGFVGADRIVSDGATEIPDISLVDVPRIVGPATKETLQSALKDALRAAKS